MDRHQDVSQLWSWLPAFRAVAEVQHVRKAAQRLHVSPSALSRTIRLLEEQLGHPLFRREGRSLRLQPAGTQLLEAVRNCMRQIDDVMRELDANTLHGVLRVVSPGTLSVAVLRPALERLAERAPQLRPQITVGSPADVSGRLLRGTLDVALQTSPLGESQLQETFLGEYASGLYVGPEHPLFHAQELAPDGVTEFGFVAPPPIAGLSPDGWPAKLPRRVDVTVTSLFVGMDLCRGGGYIGVFPDPVASRDVAVGTLRRLPVDVIALTPIFAVHRPILETVGPAEALLQELRAVVSIVA